MYKNIYAKEVPTLLDPLSVVWLKLENELLTHKYSNYNS